MSHAVQRGAALLACLALGGLALAGLPALASKPGTRIGPGADWLEGGVFTYAVFETAVEHADLASCPAAFDPEVVFCRMTLAGEMAHVFVFALEGDQRLLAVRSYPLDGDFLPF